jgi:MoxR-like ATPase
MMELHVEQPKAEAQLKDLMFNPRFHDADKLVDSADKAIVPFKELNAIGAAIQQQIQASSTLQDYGYHLCRALREPAEYGIKITDVNVNTMIKGGMGPRGVSYLARGARVNAWLNNREAIIPEDFHAIIKQIAKHRIFLNPVYDYDRDAIIDSLIEAALNTVQSP